MKAIAVTRDDRTPRLVDLPRPDPGPGEALVRTLRVGVDGTDHEVIAGSHGGFPPGEDRLVLGHEAVGVVEEAGGTDLAEGSVVVPTVRRPAGEDTEAFDRGQPDMAAAGTYHERGIEGAHGFMAEYFASPADCLVPLPRDLAPVGFLVEPLSVVAKALAHARASRSAFEWTPESAIVLGNGSLGLLALATLAERDEFDRLYCLGRRDRPDPTIDVIEALGATYVDSRETPVEALPDAHEPMDLVFEATGVPRHAFRSIEALAPNGVLALLGVPGSQPLDVDAGALHRDLVVNNKAVVGSVNSNRGQFETAIETLGALPEAFLDAVVTGVHPLGEFERAFRDDDTTIKTAVEFGAHEER